jgi:hypothetical protein
MVNALGNESCLYFDYLWCIILCSCVVTALIENTSKPLNISPEKLQILCRDNVSNERNVTWSCILCRDNVSNEQNVTWSCILCRDNVSNERNVTWSCILCRDNAIGGASLRERGCS